VSDTIVKIGKYFDGTSQYPLLVVVSPDEYRDVLSAYSSTPKIKVSDYCVGADKEPDTGKLEANIKALGGNCLLLGFGDYLASKGDMAKNYLIPYKAMVLQPQSHVAILLSAHMYPVVKEIVSGDLRMKSRAILPAVAPQIPTVDNSAFVYGIKAYLEACEKGEAVGSVKTARKISNATVINPESAFDELKHRYPNEFSKLLESNGSADNWSELLTAVNKAKKNVLQYLDAQRFASPEYIFLKHTKGNDYKSWLYFIWLKLQLTSQSYLGFIAAKAETLGLLLSTAKSAILDVKVTDNRFPKLYEQRKTLLKECNDADMADFIPMVYRQGADRIAYLTDNTKVEKQAIIVSLGEGANKDRLRTSYPALYAYLQDYQFADISLTNYFSEYKKYKVYNSIDPLFAEIVSGNAVSHPYNALPSRTSVFSGIDPDKSLLIFLDAMGAEFLGYIKEVCAELELRFVPSIARANLPTITSANREFYDDWQGSKEPPIKGIDDLKHHPERGYDFNNSPYPIHLSEELEVVREALERAKTKLSTGEYRKIIIASDHGASRLAVISPDVQIDCGTCESKSSGRYCKGDALPSGENIATENEYAVIADYSRFNGSRCASVEVHGGATLEEIVVPIIELTLANSNTQVVLENSVIEVSYKKMPELILIITPDCDAVTASVGGVVYSTEKLEKSRFKVVMPELKKGTYTLDVYESQNKIANKEFVIKNKGFTERDFF
jgi:hypothetical protein